MTKMVNTRCLALCCLLFCVNLGIKGEDALSQFPELSPIYSVSMIVEYNSDFISSGSQEYQEVFNSLKKQARIKHWKGGQLTDHVLNYPQKEVYKITNDHCVTESFHLDDPYNNASLSQAITSYGIPSISNWIYTFITINPYASKMEYDQTPYQGLLLDRFSVYDATFYVEFYFANSNWTGPRNDQAPVVLKMFYNSTRELIFSVNFYSYQDSPDISNDVYLTPLGMYCSGRKTHAEMPDLPDILTYSIESFNVQLGESLSWIFNSKVNYDKRYKIVSYDHHNRNIKPQPPFFEEGGLTVIHDFTSGVAYYIDDMFDNCTSLPMNDDFQDTKISGNVTKTWNLRSLEQKSPSELFNMNNSSFSFIGTRTIRGFLADHYLARRGDIHLPYFEANDLIVELFFLNSHWAEMARTNGFEMNTKVPMKMILSPYSEFMFPEFNYKEVYNFFNFDGEISEGFGDKHSWDFDIRRCYNSREKKTFRIVLQGPVYSTFPTELVPVLTHNSLKLFRTIIGDTVSAIRFQKLQIDYNETNVFLTATLLDTAPLEAQFIEVNNMNWKMSNYPNGTFKNITTMSLFDCQEECSIAADVLCQSAVFKASTSQCILSDVHAMKSELIPDNATIYFTRPVQTDHVEMSLANAFTIIKNMVENKAFCVDVETDEQGDKTTNYCGVQFIPDVFQTGTDTDTTWPLVGRHLAQFTEKKNWQVASMRHIDGNILADECAQICLDDASQPQCQAFSYNFKLGECMLSKPGQVGSYSSEVNYFTKNDLSRYSKYPGKVLRGDSNQAKVTDSVNDCAKLCINNKDIKCRSFDFCANQKNPAEFFCYLNNQHMSDSDTQPKDAPECDHYSRSYLIDFWTSLYKDLEISLDNFVEYDSENEESCAKICVQNYNEECKGYFLCPNSDSTKCGIVKSSQSVNDATKGTLTCSYSERLYNPDGSTYSSNLKTVTKTDGLSSGGAAGLAIGMLLLGALIPGIFLILLIIKKKRNPDEMDMQVYNPQSSS